METKQGSKGNSRSGEGRHRDWSGHGNKAMPRGELTGWRGEMSGLIRTWKQSEAVRVAHALERVDIETGRDMETKRSNEGNSLAGEVRCRDWSGH